MLSARLNEHIELSLDEANRLSKEAPPDWVKAQYTSIYKNAMMDLVSAEKGNITMKKKNPNHKWTYKFRSVKLTATETVRLDAAHFHKDDSQHKRLTSNGPLLRIMNLPISANTESTISPTTITRRKMAHVFMGKGMKPLGPVVVKDRS